MTVANVPASGGLTTAEGPPTRSRGLGQLKSRRSRASACRAGLGILGNPLVTILPAAFFAVLVVTVVTYLTLVQLLKRPVYDASSWRAS
jgi:hypothetical protein